MDEKKKDKIIICVLIGLIIVLILIMVYFLLIRKDPEPSSQPESTTTTTTTTSTTTTTTTTTIDKEDPKTLKLKMEGNRCVTNLGEYYLDKETYIISGLKFNNEDYEFKYIDKETRKYYLNDKLLFSKESNEAILVSVCNYEDYLLITMGWEGYPTTSVYDVEGHEQLMFTGDYSYKNGLLLIQDYDYNIGDEYYTMTSYSVNLAKGDFTKHQTGVDKIDCGEAIYVC